MYDNTQRAIVITYVAEGFIHLALGSISGFYVNPAHGICIVAKALDYEDLRIALDPGTPIGARRSNCKARIAKGRIIANEIRDGACAGIAERGVAICPSWLEGHRAKLVAIGCVDDFTSKRFGFG